MFDRFTERARRVITLAQEEAKRLSHDAVDAEHLLLGLLREGEGLASKLLVSLAISLERLRTQVEGGLQRGERAPDRDLPFTRRAKHVLELALDEARRLAHNYIGTEHLLLGVIRESGGAAQILESMGADLDRARAHVSYCSANPCRGPLPRTSLRGRRPRGL